MSACAAQPVALCIRRGATNVIPIRLTTSVWRYIAITAITASAPVRITAPAHNIPDCWRALIYGVRGMLAINTQRPPEKAREADWRMLTVIDADTLEINDINAADFAAYAGGGHLQIYAPMDLSGIASARMQVNDPAGAQIAYFTTADRLSIDVASASVVLSLDPPDSRAISSSGLFDIELVTTSGDVVNPVAPTSTLTVIDEQTTNHA